MTIPVRLAILGLAVIVPTVGANAEAAPPSTLLKYSVAFHISHPLKKVLGRVGLLTGPGPVIRKETAGYAVDGPVTLVVQVNKMKTGNSNRDAHMLEVLGYPKHRHIRVAVQSIRAVSGPNYDLAGRITVRGIESAFHSSAVVSEGSGRTVVVRGEFFVKLSDFGVERPSLLFYPIDDSVRVTYDLTCLLTP